jgi:quinol monooxygenase YgiN
MMKHMMVRYKVKEDKADEARDAIVEFVDAVKTNEPTTLVYQVFQDNVEPLTLFHFMIFEDEYAQTLHRKSSYVKKFVDLIYPLCSEEPVFTGLNLIRESCGGETKSS